MNRADQVLLLLGRDPAHPAETYWLTIGGGVDTGESAEDGAIREVREETGLQIEAAQLVGPFHRVAHSFSYAGVDYLSDSSFFAVAVDDVVVSFDGLDDDEVDSIIEARWWSPADLVDGMTSSDLDLPGIARAAVAAVREGT